MDHRELAQALFEEFDEDGDGRISRREFIELRKCLLGDHGVETSSKIFDHFDADHDNHISRDELIELIIEYAI